MTRIILKISAKMMTARPVLSVLTFLAVLASVTLTVVSCITSSTVICYADIALADPPDVGQVKESEYITTYENEYGKTVTQVEKYTYTVPSNKDERKAWHTAMVILALFVTAIAAVMIYASFAATFDIKTKTLGRLTALGASSAERALFVSADAIIYGVFAVPLGFLIGLFLSDYATEAFRSAIEDSLKVQADRVYFGFGRVAFAVLASIAAIAAASVIPAVRASKMTVADSMKYGEKIDIELRKGIITSVFERLFGRIGLLAGQNYFCHKYRYRSMTVTLASASLIYIGIYNFALYAAQESGCQNITDLRHDQAILAEVMSVASFLIAALVILSLVNTVSCSVLSVKRRSHEFALLRSLGMSGAGLGGMMMLECAYIAIRASMLTLAVTLIGSFAEKIIVGIMRRESLFYEYPLGAFAVSAAAMTAAALIFGIYSAVSIRGLSIAGQISEDTSAAHYKG